MKRKKQKKAFRGLIIAFTAICIFVVFTVSTISVYSANNISFSVDEELFSSVKGDNITKFYYDASGNCGKILSEYIPMEFASISGADEHRDWMPMDSFPQHLKDAFIATEDRAFYSHHGINLKRTAAAVLNYFTHSSGSFGGSTITQQVVKNISGDNARTVKRKFNEIIRAYHLEFKHTKEEIFEVYLNIVPMGEGICGIGLASSYFFGKEPQDLTIAEAATLVGMANAPTRYNPYSNHDSCLKKRNTVLSSMLECGYISSGEYEAARSTPILLKEKNEQSSKIQSWFVETVCDELCADLADKKSISRDAARIMILNGGLSVYTTMDERAQQIIEDFFENDSNFAADLESAPRYSMVITDPNTADLLAVVGDVGRKNGNRLLNNALAPHPPASTLKPLALYAPLIDSRKITWSTVLDDVPTDFKEASDGTIVEFPRNSPNIYDGLTTISTAIEKSKNTIAVQLYNILGHENIYRNLYDNYKFTTLVDKETGTNGGILTDRAVSPLALGQLTRGVTLRRLTEAYTAFSSYGMVAEGRSYVLCHDSNDNILITKSVSQKRIMSHETAEIMNQLLMKVTDTGTASKITLKELLDVAGKTGTSAKSLDKLFVGFTPYYTAGIWCGSSDGKTGVIGSEHLTVWDKVMTEIHQEILLGHDLKYFRTDGLIYSPFCTDSGKLYSPWCTADPRGSRLEYGYFIKGTEPSYSCDRHILCRDGDSGELISLLAIPTRNFPKEIIVSDSKYIYKHELFDEPNNYYGSESFGTVKNRKRRFFNSLQY